MERSRQLLRHDVRQEEWDETLRLLDCAIEPFAREQASRFAIHSADEDRWRRLYRDAIITGHVQPDDVLWTTNPADFLEIGLRPAQVVAV